jgi:hypothetical protein
MMKARMFGWVIAGFVALTLAIGGTGLALAQGPNGMTGGNGPNGAGYPGMGPGGMMGGSGSYSGYSGMMNGSGPFAGGAGMMGGRGPMGGYATNGTEQPVTSLDQAQQAVQAYLDRYGNANLAVDEVMEFQQNCYAIVKEKDTATKAFEVLVDRNTGTVFPEYGPNMIWNTKYGMMHWQNSSTQPLTVSPEQATQIAGQWLVQNQPGAMTETPDTFYGYYTLHIMKGGKVTGMLSVNGYTSQVWYHTWHGAFIGMKEAGA